MAFITVQFHWTTHNPDVGFRTVRMYERDRYGNVCFNQETIEQNVDDVERKPTGKEGDQ